MTEHEELSGKFSSWLSTAMPGEKYCYFRGDCLNGCFVGRLALSAYENGLVTLFQRKVRNGLFEYYAQRVALSAKPEWI